MNPEAMVLLLNYREDGVTRACPVVTTCSNVKTRFSLAYFTIWKDGVEEVKL